MEKAESFEAVDFALLGKMSVDGDMSVFAAFQVLLVVLLAPEPPLAKLSIVAR
jgi:hypothetical protein